MRLVTISTLALMAILSGVVGTQETDVVQRLDPAFDQIANGRKLFDAASDKTDVVPDGMKVDTAGNLYLGGPAGS